MGKRKRPLLDRILVVDVESTCWDGEISVKPPGMKSEIIEMGIALLDHRTGEIEKHDQLLVKPEVSEVSEFCTQLTGWTSRDLEKGVRFADACAHLKETLLSRRRIFASWGNYDRRQFERQCKLSIVGYPFGPSHLNVKDLFAIRTGNHRHVNVMEAIENLGLEFDGKWHNGRDDAYNIARILWTLIKPDSLIS